MIKQAFIVFLAFVNISQVKADEQTFTESNIDEIVNLTKTAAIYQNNGDYKKAEIFHRKAYEKAKSTKHTSDEVIAQLENNLASSLLANSKYKEAEDVLLSSSKHYENIIQKNNMGYATSLINLAELKLQLREFDESEVYIQKAEDVISKYLKEDGIQSGMVKHVKAKLLAQQDKSSESRKLYSESISIFEKIFGRNNQYVEKLKAEYEEYNKFLSGVKVK